MRYRHRPHRIWFALAIGLAGLLGMGSMILGPRRVASDPTLPTTIAPVAVLETPAPTATRKPAEAPTPTPTATGTPIPAPTSTPSPVPAPPVTPDGEARGAQVPILMYHYVGGLPAGADAYRVDLTVSPERFEAQLAYLQAAGYTSVTLEDLVRHLATGTPLPPKAVVLTFDDGYLDNFLYAFPLLRQYNYRGTFFVVTQFLDEGRAGYMSWEQVRLMQDSGMDIEAHGISHEDLSGQSPAFVEREVTESRRAIEAHLHRPVQLFAYPYGRYDSRVIAALRSAGYLGAVTTKAGVQHTSNALFELARVRVHGGHGLDEFVATLDYYLR